MIGSIPKGERDGEHVPHADTENAKNEGRPSVDLREDARRRRPLELGHDVYPLIPKDRMILYNAGDDYYSSRSIVTFVRLIPKSSSQSVSFGFSTSVFLALRQPTPQ